VPLVSDKCTKHHFIYTLVNGNTEKLAHQKQQKLQKVILPASHWLRVNVLLNDTVKMHEHPHSCKLDHGFNS